MIGRVLSALAVCGLVLIGTSALIAPRTASAQYGIVLEDPRALALFRAMGIRDVVIGLVLGLLWLEDARSPLAWAMLATTLIAVVDLAVVTIDRRRRPAGEAARDLDRSRMLHAAGAIGLLVTAVILRSRY